MPPGFLGMLALVVLAESFIANGHGGRFTTIGTASWTYSGREATRSNVRGSEILVFGDSQVKFGLLPRLFEQRLGKRSFNLAVHGGGPQTSEFLFRRALDAGAKPAAVIVDFPPETMLADHTHTRLSEFPELGKLRDWLELAWASQDSDVFAAAFTAGVLPSYRDRYNIRACALAALRGEGSPLPGQLPVYWRNWNRNLGAHVMPPNPQFHGEVNDPSFKPLFLSPWESRPLNALYVRRFFALAARNHIPAFWIIQPTCPQAQKIREDLGTDAAYTAFVRTVMDEFPSLVVIDVRHSGYEDKVFRDPVHLDRHGASALSNEVAAILDRKLNGHGADPRWIMLPKYRNQDARDVLEDLEESLAAVYSPSGVRR